MIPLLFLLFLTTQVYTEQTKCVGIHFRDAELYEPVILKEGLNNIRGLTYSAPRNSLYFTFTNLDDKFTSKTAVYNLSDKSIEVIEEVNNTRMNLADDNHDLVFIASANGIFRIDSNNSIDKTLVNNSVLSMSIANNDVYYVNSNHQVFGLRNNRIEELVMLKAANVIKLVVNSIGDVVFINTLHQVGSLKNGHLEFRVHPMIAKTLTIDQQDTIYICAEDGLYEYSVTGDSFTKIAYLPNLQGLVFTSENTPIYASTGMLVQLNQKICL